MRTSEDSRRRLGRHAAEALLDGAAPAPGDDDAFIPPPLSAVPDLPALLAAAAGPALPEELGGEAAARAAYLAAHRPGPATNAKEKRMFSKIMLGKALAIKVTAACLGLGVAGYATAAETGALPRSWQATAHSAFGGMGVPAAKVTADVQVTASLGAALPAVHATDGDHHGDADQGRRDGDGAWLLGSDAGWLCRAAQHGDQDSKGLDLKVADLQKLAKAAGVPQDQINKLTSRLEALHSQAQRQMQDFCTRLDQAMQDIKNGKVPAFPIPPIKPGLDWPANWPTTWPGGLPTGLPSQWPTDWPSQWPTGLPSKLPSLPIPSGLPTGLPSGLPSGLPTKLPTGWPSLPGHLPSGSVSIGGGVGGGH